MALEDLTAKQNEFIRELEQLILQFQKCSSTDKNQFDKSYIIISSNIDTVIQNVALQEVFFKFSLAILRAANHEQFQQTMALLLDKYSPILRSALTDIWVLLADSADSIFGSLQKYFNLFKELQSASAVEFSSYSAKVFVDCTSVVTVCVDFLQTVTMSQQSEVNKVAQLLSCLIVILINGNAVKLRSLHEKFQRMLRAGCDPNVHLVLLGYLFQDCSIQFSSTLHYATHHQTKSNLWSDIGQSSKKTQKLLQSTAEDDEGSSSDCVGTAEKREANQRSRISMTETAIPCTIQRVPASLALLQLFSFERLKFLCLSLDALTDALEDGLRSVSAFFRPFKCWGSARLKKLISNIFTIISTLHLPLNASQLTIKSMLSIAEQLVLLYPRPKFLFEFFRLSMSDGPMLQIICQSLRLMLERCPFEPGEVLLFPQRQHLFMSSDPTECAIRGPSVETTSTHPSPFSMEHTAAHFKLDSLYNLSGITVSCWVSKITKISAISASVSSSHILSLVNEHVRISAEFSSIDSVQISISRFTNGACSVLHDFVFKGIFHDGHFFNVALGLRICDGKCKTLFAVGDNVKSVEVPIFSHGSQSAKTSACSCVDVAFGSKSCLGFDEDNLSDAFYQLTTIFGFRGLLPLDLVLLLRAVGSACFCLAECHHSSTLLSFYSCFSSETIASPLSAPLAQIIKQPKKYLALLRRLLLFTVRPTSAHSYSLYSSNHFGKRMADESQNVPIEWNTNIVHNYVTTLDKSFRTIGGVKLFVFLYALSVDRAHPSATQLEALRLLFLSLRRDPSYCDEWNCQDGDANSSSAAEFGPHLLVRCLTSRMAQLDEHIFQVNFCCCNLYDLTFSVSPKEVVRFIFSYTSRDDQSQIVPSDRTVLLEPKFVQALISYTDIWKGHCFAFWVQLTQIVAKCISYYDEENIGTKDGNENTKRRLRQFNLLQLQRVNFLRHFLFSLLDMLSNNHLFQFFSSAGTINARRKPSTALSLGRGQSIIQSSHLADSIGQIIHQLVGGFASDYNSEKIGELWHFLLLSHPAKDAFLDYSIEPSDSRCAWLNDGDDFEQTQTATGHEQLLIRNEYKSELSDHLDKLLQRHGREMINQLWLELNGSAVVLRQRLYNANDSDKWCSSLTSNFLDETTKLQETKTPSTAHQQNDVVERETCDDDIDVCVAKQQPKNGPGEHWLVHVRVRLLRLMCEVVLNSDDSTIANLEANVLSWQTILVLLSKQHFRQLRSLTFILLKNIFLRSSATFRQTFITHHGFLLLSREMRGTSMNFSIADALFSMTCGEHVLLKNGCLDTAHLEKLVIDPFKAGSFSALFTLMEESVSHPALFWSVCSTLQKIFATESAPRQSMLRLGLVDSMANVLRRLCCRSADPQKTQPNDGEMEMFPLFDCWLSFAQSILNSLVPYDDPFCYSSCEEFVWLCIIALWKDEGRWTDDFDRRTPPFSNRTIINSSGSSLDHSKHFFLDVGSPSASSSCNPLLRLALCQILFCWIGSLRSTLSDKFRTPSSFSSLAASVRLHEMQRNRRECSSSADSSDFELVPNASQWLLTADSSFGDIIRLHGTHSAASAFSPGFASNEENANRLLYSLVMIRNLFLFFELPYSATDAEEILLKTFLDILFAACCSSPRKANIKLDDWQSILQYPSFLRRARYLLLETIAFLLFPAQIKSRKLQARHSPSSQPLFSSTPKCSKIAGYAVDFKRIMAHNCSNEKSADSLPWSLRRRFIVVRFLAKELRQSRENMTLLMELNLDFQFALKIGLHELCLLPFTFSSHYEAISEYDVDLELLIKFMHSIGIRSPLANLTMAEIDSLTTDEVLLLQQFDEIKGQFCAQMMEKAKAIWDREYDLLKLTSDQAITLTCEVAEYQNVPRRLLIAWKKELQREWSRANRTLAHFVKELCHPEAPFFAPFSWPIGRVLNTTENLSRERRRFSAAHYSFPLKFFKSERCKAIERVHNMPMPLDNLLNGGNPQQRHAFEHTEVEDPIRMSISATIMRTAFECAGELAVSDQKLHFLGESAKSTQKGVVHAPVTYSWDYDQIREIHIRFYQLKDTALELFTTTGDAFLVVFESEKDRSVLLQQFRILHLDKLVVDHKTQLRSATQMWRRGTLTNFGYLMTLNKLAGRTFNDLMQYPVFPFVLSDYSSETLDLTNPSSYRNLTKPMAIQDSRMEKVYAHNYQSLAEEYNRFDRSGDSVGSSSNNVFSSVRFGPYHYGSHYSNTGIVAHYLVRISPYTSVALEYQDNNFDIPDRLFSSLDTTWRLSSSESTTDFKELIPEFFYLYEMFRNDDELELGVRQAGDPVDHVQVPPWCPRGDHRLVCTLLVLDAFHGSDDCDHQKHANFCLYPVQKTDYHVTANLHHWIDLIFGFKQSGDNAARAMNVFHPATYRGRDFVESGKGDPLIVCAIQTMIRTYGQMPLQLFDAPHLPHLNATKCQNQPTTPKSQNSTGHLSVSACPFQEHFHTIVGVRWGDFVGSPEHDGFCSSTPSRVFTPGTKRTLRLTHVHSDQDTAICYGIPESTELIVCYRADRKDPLRIGNELALCAIVSWGPSNFIDNILRIKLIYAAAQPHKKYCQLSATSTDVPQQQWERLIDLQSLQLCRVTYSSTVNSLLLGFRCGLIRLYSLHYDQQKWNCRLRSSLYAHSCAITCLSISDQFHVILSASIDAKICLWDANNHNFERRFPLPPSVFSGSAPIEETVTLSCMSSISADVAVVFQSGLAGSRLALYSINGELIGLYRERQRTITSIAMTDLPEGTAINCVAIGFQTGMIRLIEMWTMTAVRDISFQSFQTPVISLLFSDCSRRLYAAFGNSHVLCWQVPSVCAVAGAEATTTSSREQPCFKVLSPFKVQ